MTAENMAKFRLDPNIDFWKNLKDGSDHFEVTKTEPSVLVCGKHYVFDATAKDEVSGSEPCPALKRDQNVEALVAEKEDKDETKVAELVATGVKPIRLVYADGGQNPVFHRLQGRKRPGRAGERTARDRPWRPGEASARGGEDRRGGRGQEARRKRGASARRGLRRRSRLRRRSPPSSAPANQSSGMLGGLTGGAKNVQKWLHLGGQEPAPPPVAAAANDPDQQVPPSPLPPRRDDVHLASLHTPPTPPTRRNSAETQADAPDSAPSTRRRSNSDALTRESRSPPIPDPSREAGKEARRLLGVSERSSWHDDRGAVPRPYVNKTAGVFRLFAIGVAQVQCAPVHVKRQGFIAERGRQRARRLKALDRGPPFAARAANPPMIDQSLDHERGGGQDDRRLAGAAADETGQRQHGRKGHDQREGGQRRHVAGEQSALERRAQP